LLSVAHSAVSAVIGLHLGVWLDCSIAAAKVEAGTFLYALARLFSPTQGLMRYFLSPPEIIDQLRETTAASA
jgi:ABC-type Mn2+/Zn2+ transport system permease subunit